MSRISDEQVERMCRKDYSDRYITRVEHEMALDLRDARAEKADLYEANQINLSVIKERQDKFEALQTTLALADELAKAAQGVPEPSDEGFCEGCCRRPEVIRDDVKLKDGTLYPRYRLDHDASCWYGRIWRALAAYQKGRGEPDEAGPQS
jgi:hypothetical protein